MPVSLLASAEMGDSLGNVWFCAVKQCVTENRAHLTRAVHTLSPARTNPEEPLHEVCSPRRIVYYLPGTAGRERI